MSPEAAKLIQDALNKLHQAPEQYSSMLEAIRLICNSEAGIKSEPRAKP